MSMEISGGFDYSRINYGEEMEEKALHRAEEAKGTARASSDAKTPERASVPQDEYISSERSGVRPTGLYRVGQDEKGNRKLFFDDPRKSGGTDGKAQQTAGGDGPKAKGNGSEEGGNGRSQKVSPGRPEESEEKCVADTDKVEREIRELKKRQQQLEQQIRTASGDDRKARELEKKLAQVENELARKDNDTYRRQNASVVDLG